MDSLKLIDTSFKIIGFLLGSGILVYIIKISKSIGSYEKWMATIDKEVSSHGVMLQQINKDMSFLKGRFTKDKQE